MTQLRQKMLEELQRRHYALSYRKHVHPDRPRLCGVFPPTETFFLTFPFIEQAISLKTRAARKMRKTEIYRQLGILSESATIYP